MLKHEDFLTDLLDRRCNLYEQLRVLDNHVADAQRSAFFGSVPDNEITTRHSIERVEGQIKDVNLQIGGIRGPKVQEAA